MQWLFELHETNPTAQAIALLAFVCVVGMTLGGIQFRGIKLGSSGVLFAALVVGHFSKPVNHLTLEFVKEFGLILFVFCIGLQLGPGFFASLRRSGVRLNLLALSIVALGLVFAIGAGQLLRLDGAAVLGIFSGATTNTPSLGAAQQALVSFPGITPARAALPALAYAVSYPVGIVGIIGTLLIFRTLFRIDIQQERQRDEAARADTTPPLERRTLVVENPNLEDLPLSEVPGLVETGVRISRVRRAGESAIRAATSEIRLHRGDSLHAVGSPHGLDRFQRVIGSASPETLLVDDSIVQRRKIVLTRSDAVGRALGELQLEPLHGVVVTTVVRGEVELLAGPGLELRFGDVLQVVGPEQALARVADELGNQVRALDETQFVPLFAGIGVGILLGTMPIPFPGLPQPLRLGLAAGPLIIAILVGRLGRVGRLVWYMPRNANLAFRELGIALFFASVGLLAGPRFFAAAFSLTGLLWVLAAVCVTMLPLLIIGVYARRVLSMNYLELSGLIAGSMTDPPALAFASHLCGSETPAVSYAAVYPLTMLLRILCAQTLAVALCG